jgi:predicted DNA-binding protein with PD1-like motif
VTVHIIRSERSRHFVVRLSSGELLPDALVARLRDEGVTCGWLRGSGVLVDVELRAFDAELGALGSPRRIAGPVHALCLDGGIGPAGGETSLSLRALLARDADRGLETLAGEISGAQTIAVEALVTALDDVHLERSLDSAAGVWLFGPATSSASSPLRPGPAVGPGQRSAPRKEPRAEWSAALAASGGDEREAGTYPRTTELAVAPGPPKPPRSARSSLGLDSPTPEAGDSVDHFAFGRCDVLRSDGDRLHLKVHKDGRIREIALEMLRVTPLGDDAEGRHRFKLERKI